MEEQRSYFERVVCLRSWWLVKAEEGFDGKKLAVGGLDNGEKEARTVFTSAPILKRYDVFNLVTVDGIIVNLQGFIDKARTEANGFSSEIVKHFLFGFPPNWEGFAKKCLSTESRAVLLTGNNTGIEASSPQAGEHESADKDIVQRSLDSSNADKDQYLSVETVHVNHNSVSIVWDTKQGETTSNPNQQKRKKNYSKALRNSKSSKNDLTSADKSKRGVTADRNLSSRDPKKKSAHVNESTPVHDRVHIVSPDAASFRRSRSGRLLLPSLEYWRNQRVLYDTDGNIIGVLDLES